STKVKEEFIDLTGETNREVSTSTRASVRYTLVESATRAVRWSDSSSFSSSGNKLSAALDGFLDKIIGDISEIVSPPKVVAVTNGRVVINRGQGLAASGQDRKSTRLNSSHVKISYAVFCLKKKNT